MVVWHLSARFVPDTCIPGHVLTFMQELFVTPPLYYLVNNLPNREYFSNVVGGGYLMYSTLRNGVSNRRGSFFWKSSRWLRLRFHVRGNFSLFGASALCNGMRRYWRYSLWRWKLWNIRKYECKVVMHCVGRYYIAGYMQWLQGFGEVCYSPKFDQFLVPMQQDWRSFVALWQIIALVLKPSEK